MHFQRIVKHRAEGLLHDSEHMLWCRSASKMLITKNWLETIATHYTQSNQEYSNQEASCASRGACPAMEIRLTFIGVDPKLWLLQRLLDFLVSSLCPQHSACWCKLYHSFFDCCISCLHLQRTAALCQAQCLRKRVGLLDWTSPRHIDLKSPTCQNRTPQNNRKKTHQVDPSLLVVEDISCDC